MKGRTPREIALDIIWRPIEVITKEPVYRFTVVEMGATFLLNCIGIALGAWFYIPMLRRKFTLN